MSEIGTRSSGWRKATAIAVVLAVIALTAAVTISAMSGSTTGHTMPDGTSMDGTMTTMP